MPKNVLLIAIASVFLVGCYHTSTKPSSVSPQQTQEASVPPMTVSLAALNNSGVDGTAILESANGQAKVTITLREAVADDSIHPAHIHVGVCPNPGAVKYPLNDVINGKSETTLAISLDTLQQGGPLAINVHRSAEDTKTYLSCGDV